jgi:hypothetical protein
LSLEKPFPSLAELGYFRSVGGDLQNHLGDISHHNSTWPEKNLWVNSSIFLPVLENTSFQTGNSFFQHPKICNFPDGEVLAARIYS